MNDNPAHRHLYIFLIRGLIFEFVLEIFQFQLKREWLLNDI